MTDHKICSFRVDDRIFNKDAVLKTAYLFTDRYYVHLSYDKEHMINITISAKPESDMKDVDRLFCNELLAQMLRYRIATENRTSKELILGRALYATCIDTVEDEDPDTLEDLHSGYSLDDIAVDWFDSNE